MYTSAESHNWRLREGSTRFRNTGNTRCEEQRRKKINTKLENPSMRYSTRPLDSRWTRHGRGRYGMREGPGAAVADCAHGGNPAGVRSGGVGEMACNLSSCLSKRSKCQYFYWQLILDWNANTLDRNASTYPRNIQNIAPNIISYFFQRDRTADTYWQSILDRNTNNLPKHPKYSS